jgi:hypothetical protein
MTGTGFSSRVSFGFFPFVLSRCFLYAKPSSTSDKCFAMEDEYSRTFPKSIRRDPIGATGRRVLRPMLDAIASERFPILNVQRGAGPVVSTVLAAGGCDLGITHARDGAVNSPKVTLVAPVKLSPLITTLVTGAPVVVRSSKSSVSPGSSRCSSTCGWS